MPWYMKYTVKKTTAIFKKPVFFFFFKMQVQVKEILRHEKERPFDYTCLLFISFARVADLIRHQPRRHKLFHPFIPDAFHLFDLFLLLPLLPIGYWHEKYLISFSTGRDFLSKIKIKNYTIKKEKKCCCPQCVLKYRARKSDFLFFLFLNQNPLSQ